MFGKFEPLCISPDTFGTPHSEEICGPCHIPSAVAGKSHSFRDAFFDRGGLVAEVIKAGAIKAGSAVIPPKKDY